MGGLRWSLVGAGVMLACLALWGGVAGAEDEPAPGPEGICVLPPSLCSPFPGSLRIAATPDTSAPFGFTVTDDDGGVAHPNGTEAVPATAFIRPLTIYDIRLTSLAPGYALTRVTCTGAHTTVVGTRVHVEKFDPLLDLNSPPPDCTFTVKRPGSIRISQSTNPSSDADFSYSTTGTGLSAFQLDNDELGDDRGDLPRARTFTGLGPGQYTVTLANRTPFRLTGLTCTTGESPAVSERRVTIDLSQGEDVSCSFAITELARVQLVLDVAPEDPADVTFDTSALGGSSALVLDDDGVPGPSGRSNVASFALLLPGDYSVRQVTDLAGQGIDLRSISCDGRVLANSTVDRSVTFRLAAAQRVRCTFRNEARGSITVVEDSRPDGPRDYLFSHNDTPATFTLDDDPADPTFPRQITFVAHSGSVHVITQEPAGGLPPWLLVSLTCDTGEQPNLSARSVVVTVDPGEDVTCTFGNAQFLPDALIAPAGTGPFQGDDIRSADLLVSQSLEKPVNSGGQTVFVVEVQNDSGITDDLVVSSVESGGNFDVTYRTGGVDVTAQVVGGGFTFEDVAPGGQRTVRIQFNPRAGVPAGGSRRADVTVHSAAAPAAADVVRAQARRV